MYNLKPEESKNHVQAYLSHLANSLQTVTLFSLLELCIRNTSEKYRYHNNKSNKSNGVVILDWKHNKQYSSKTKNYIKTQNPTLTFYFNYCMFLVWILLVFRATMRYLKPSLLHFLLNFHTGTWYNLAQYLKELLTPLVPYQYSFKDTLSLKMKVWNFKANCLFHMMSLDF